MKEADEVTAIASGVRLFVYESFVQRGYPPTLREISRRFAIGSDEAMQALSLLEDDRALILLATRDRIRVAPPFSAVPTTFWVQSRKGGWWGACAWESLGILALLESDGVIRTLSGADGAPLEIAVRKGTVVDSGAIMHVAVPPARFWNDVLYTCSTVLFFRDDDELADWSRRHDISIGGVVHLEQAWSLANDWFAGRLEKAWRRLTADEARASFKRAGLSGDFWTLDASHR